MAKAEVLNGGHGLSVQLYDQANRQLIAFFEQYLRTIFKIEQAIQEKNHPYYRYRFRPGREC